MPLADRPPTPPAALIIRHTCMPQRTRWSNAASAVHTVVAIATAHRGPWALEWSAPAVVAREIKIIRLKFGKPFPRLAFRSGHPVGFRHHSQVVQRLVLQMLATTARISSGAVRSSTGIGPIHLCHANSSACANEAHSTASDAACSNMELWQMLTGRANKQALAKLRRIENGRCFLVHLVVAAPKEMAQR